MKKNIYKFKISYTLIGVMQAIRQPEYGDIVEIIRDDALLVGIVYEIDNTNLENSMAFIRQYGGDLYRLGSNYTIRDPSPNLNRQIIANDFEAWWWYDPNNQVHIENSNINRPEVLYGDIIQIPNPQFNDQSLIGILTDNNQVFVLDERLVIGLFHKATKCNSQSIAAIDSHEVTGQYCELRNNAPLEEVQGGMGDIFIRLAKDN